MGAMAVAGRIENHRFVAVAAADLALDELPRVLYDPMDGPLVQAGKFRIAAGPGHDVPRGVDVHHLGPGRGGRQRARARVGEEVSTRGRVPAATARATCRWIHAQFSACSGNSPIWPNGVGRSSSTSCPCVTVQGSGNDGGKDQRPSRSSLRWRRVGRGPGRRVGTGDAFRSRTGAIQRHAAHAFQAPGRCRNREVDTRGK